jgi:hypothetical protein
MRIILDDRRSFSNYEQYNCVRKYEECTNLIRLFRHISFISLDYDLGEEKTGLSVLEYMVECGCDVKRINIHSDHSIGVPKMREFAEKHFPNASLTFNRL